MGFDLEVAEVLQEQFEQKLELIKAQVAKKATKACMRTRTHSAYHSLISLDFLKQTTQFFALAF